MTPLFKIGKKRLDEIAAEAQGPNVLTFTRDKARRKREAARLANWRRQALAEALLAAGRRGRMMGEFDENVADVSQDASEQDVSTETDSIAEEVLREPSASEYDAPPQSWKREVAERHWSKPGP